MCEEINDSSCLFLHTLGFALAVNYTCICVIVHWCHFQFVQLVVEKKIRNSRLKDVESVMIDVKTGIFIKTVFKSRF